MINMAKRNSNPLWKRAAKVSLVSAVILSIIPFLLGLLSSAIPVVGSYFASFFYAITLFAFLTWFVVIFIAYYIMVKVFHTSSAFQLALLAGIAGFLTSGFDIIGGFVAFVGAYTGFHATKAITE